METLKLILGTTNFALVAAGGFFIVLGVLLRSLIKAKFIWIAFLQTNWLKKAVGLICAATIMRFLQEYYQVDNESTLLFIAFGLGLGSDLCVHFISKLPETKPFSFLNGKKTD